MWCCSAKTSSMKYLHGDFFERWAGSSNREIVRAPCGEGSAEQFVRECFPRELAEYRCRRNSVKITLVVVIDGDQWGLEKRRSQLKAACKEQKVEFVGPQDRVLIIVPTWRIETWIAYLDGENVDESKPDYRRLDRCRDCQLHVEELAHMCRNKKLRTPVPDSLTAACREYQRIMGA